MAAITKTIKVGDQEIVIGASAALPRKYRIKFGRDIFEDLNAIAGASKKDGLSGVNMEIFENIAYISAKEADPDGVPDDVMEWLDQFEMFDVWSILPEVMAIWNLNGVTLSEAKKKEGQQKGK